MAYLVDGIIILILVLSIWSGHKRGFIKSVSGLMAFLAATLVAALLSGPVAGFVYDAVVEPDVVSTMEEYLVSTTENLEGGIDQALEALPAFVTNLLNKSGVTTGADVLAKVTAAEEDVTLAQQIANQVVEPLVVPLLKAICLLVLFIVAYFLCSLVLRVLDVTAKLPLLKQLNKGLGAVGGAVTGLLWVLFAVSLLQVTAAITGPDFVINQALLEDTLLTRWLIAINPVGGALREITALMK